MSQDTELYFIIRIGSMQYIESLKHNDSGGGGAQAADRTFRSAMHFLRAASSWAGVMDFLHTHATVFDINISTLQQLLLLRQKSFLRQLRSNCA